MVSLVEKAVVYGSHTHTHADMSLCFAVTQQTHSYCYFQTLFEQSCSLSIVLADLASLQVPVLPAAQRDHSD